MAIRIGGPRIDPPPPPPKVDPPKPPPPVEQKKLELNQSSEFGNELGEGVQSEAQFSGKVTVPIEVNGQTQQLQLTALDGVLSQNGQAVGKVIAERADGQLEVEVAGKRAVVTPESAPPPTPGELLPYPSGRPETYIKTQFPPTPGATADRQTMIDTVVSVLPKEKQAETRALLETGGAYGKEKSDSGGDLLTAGVSDASLKKAFDQVLEARRTPGQKQLSLELIPERHSLVQDVGSESSSGPREVVEQGKPVALKFGMSVDAQGQVNGAALKIDQLTRLSTELTKVGPDLKQEALKNAGLSDEWIGNATPEQREMALAKLREATLTPGTKTLDLGFDITVQSGGGDGDTTYSTRKVEATLTLKVDDKGNVDGKPLFIETALATNKVFEQLPISEKKSMLQKIGFTADDLKPVNADGLTDILSRIAMKSREPGEHQLIIDNGPDKFAVGLKVSQSGELEGVGVTKLPPPPKQSTFKKILGPVLTVVSVVFPVTAPFIAVIQAGMAVANGAKGLGLVGAVLGGAAGVAGIAGFAGAASTLQSAASVVNGVNGAVQGIKNGDFLGAFSSAVSAAGGAGLGNSTISTLGQVAGVGSAIRSGDLGGAISGAVGLASNAVRSNQPEAGKPTPPPDDLDGPTQQIPTSTTPSEPTDDLGGPTAPIDTRGVTGGDDLDGPTSMIPTSAAGGSSGVPDDVFVGPPAPSEPEPEPQASVTVKRGDTLSTLAEKYLGDAGRWPELYEFNKDKIGDNPNRLGAGVELDIPPQDYALSPSEKNDLFNGAVMPPKTDANGAALIGIDENGEPEYSDYKPEERAELKAEVKKSFEAPHEPSTALEILKGLGDLKTLVDDPVKEGLIAKALAGGNTAILGELLHDEDAMTKLAARLPTEQAGKLLKLVHVVDLASKGATFYEGYEKSVSDQIGGRIASGAGALLGDLIIGKASPVLDVIDSTVSLVANVAHVKDLTGLDVDQYSIKKTMGAGYQNLAVIAEALGSPPERRDELMTKLVESIKSGPAAVKGYLLIGQELSDSSFGVYLMDKLFEYKDQKALAEAQAQKAEALRRRVAIIQGSG